MIKYLLFLILLILPLLFYSQLQNFEADYDLSICKGTVPKGLKASFLDRLEETKLDDKTKSKKGRKENNNFYESSHYYLDQLLRSGKVLFGDELTTYVNKVANNLLTRSNKSILLSHLDFYVLKSQNVNAFTMQDGSIFVTVGLLAQIENEEELAFVLAHEIAHFELKHNIKGFKKTLELEKKNRKGVSEISDLLKILSNYSKQSELEADELGLKTYLSAGYSSRYAKETMLVLQYSFLPFDEKKINNQFFNTDIYKIPKHYYDDDLSTDVITDKSDRNDEFTSHPNIKKRINQIDSLIKSIPISEIEIQTNQSLFEYTNTKARFEQLYLGLLDKDFLRVIYEAYLLKTKYPNNQYIDKQIALGLYGLFKIRLADNKLSKGIIENYDKEGQILRLKVLLMTHMSLEELALLAIDKLDNLHKDELLIYRNQIIDDLLHTLNFDYKKLLNKNKIINNKNFKKLDSISYLNLTKIQKVEYNQKKLTFDRLLTLKKKDDLDSNNYYLTIFSDKDENSELFEKFKELDKEQIIKKESFFKRIRNKKKNIDSIIVIEPIYLDLRSRELKEDIVFYKSSIIKKEKLRNSIAKVSEKYNKQIINLESSNFDSISIKDLNADFVLKEWYNELFINDELDLLSFSQTRADIVFEELMCKNIMIVVILNDRKRFKRTFKFIIIINKNGNVMFSDFIKTRKQGHPIYNELFINDVFQKISKK